MITADSSNVEQPDSHCMIINLIVPAQKIVLFQAYFDIYENIGIIRTIDIKNSQVSVITTPDMFSDCVKLLMDIQKDIGWL